MNNATRTHAANSSNYVHTAK